MTKQASETAVEVLRGAAGAAAAENEPAQQLELMPAMRPSLTEHQVERIEKAMRADRRGRPPGAQNKSTREMLEFVRKLCGDPLERRFRYAMHTPETLAIELGCTKLEAFDRLEKLWADLTGFFYAKQAQVDGQGNAVTPRLTMVFTGQVAPSTGADGAPRAPWLYIEQNQTLSAPDTDVSHGDVSHGEDSSNDISDLQP